MKEIEIYRDYGTVSKDVIESFASELGFSFPEYYMELLSKHDALWPQKREFYFELEDNKDSRDVVFFGFGSKLRANNKIERAQQEECGWDKIVVIGRSANGDYICFDYRDYPMTDNPPVILMFHDFYDNENRMNTHNISQDFESFIEGLEDIDYDE